ncbi:hypothetical protein FSP39_011559 [Pinctada imbricata]|uniref:G-protein coupled receptors family 1 profile domain-containing protein n=1 Tax=Pinctada imbricata TaxID=66713 RepID=A0AA89C0I9_PINIB|nr:hypothetical protein FSP39_011559 [Pinctada imbricata]
MISQNSTITDLVPLAFVSRERSLPTIVVNAVLFVVGFIANLTVFVTLFRNRTSQSRCNRFILHLSFADLAVITIVPPTEIAWHSSITWDYGNFACKLYKFAYIFGQNATSFILIMISIDRFIAIVYPMVLPSVSKRNSRIMLATAWILSFLASIPQLTLNKADADDIATPVLDIKINNGEIQTKIYDKREDIGFSLA